MNNLDKFKYGFVNNYYVKGKYDKNFKYNYNYKYNNNILITDWLWGYNSINIIKLRPDIIDNKYFLKSEYDEFGYLDYFYRNDVIKDNITHIIIQFIDRGIPDFIAFSNMLNELYPNLSILEFAQNYSYGNEDILKQNFLYFIKNCKCDKLYINDHQSCFLYHINNNELFKNMKDNMLIIFKICNKEEYMIKDEKNNNKIIKIIDDTNLSDY